MKNVGKYFIEREMYFAAVNAPLLENTYNTFPPWVLVSQWPWVNLIFSTTCKSMVTPHNWCSTALLASDVIDMVDIEGDRGRSSRMTQISRWDEKGNKTEWYENKGHFEYFCQLNIWRTRIHFLCKSQGAFYIKPGPTLQRVSEQRTVQVELRWLFTPLNKFKGHPHPLCKFTGEVFSHSKSLWVLEVFNSILFGLVEIYTTPIDMTFTAGPTNVDPVRG